MDAQETLTSELADFLPYQLSVASNAISSRIAERYRERGRAMHAEIMPLARAMERELFACLSPEELERFRICLTLVRQAAGEFDPDTVGD